LTEKNSCNIYVIGNGNDNEIDNKSDAEGSNDDLTQVWTANDQRSSCSVGGLHADSQPGNQQPPGCLASNAQRVQDVVENMGYQPSALARSLIQQRSYTLGVVTAGLKYIGSSRTLSGITAAASQEF